MKRPFFRFALCVIVCLIHIHFNQVGASSLPPTEDYKPENRHYARTFAANLDVGEPRTVRLVYIIPHDGTYNQDVVDKMKVDIITAQQFFASELERHGYGYRLFNIERDTDGTPLVHVLKHENKAEDFMILLYDNFDLLRNAYFVLYDNGEWNFGSGDAPPFAFYTGGGNICPFEDDDLACFGSMVYEGGAAVLPTFTHSVQVLQHELGHVFRLSHNKNDQEFTMYHGLPVSKLSECNARFLAMHPYFNHGIPLETTMMYGAPRPWWLNAFETIDIEVIMPETYMEGDKSFPITLKVKNPNGVYQVFIEADTDNTRGTEFVECQHGDGSTNAVFEFEYSGPPEPILQFELNDSDEHLIQFNVIDLKGNHYRTYMLAKKFTGSPYDVNDDGAINVLDLVSVAKHINNNIYDRFADVNDDGVINVLDLIIISQALQ